MTEKVVYSLPENFDWEDETNNLLLNMSGGLLPKDLSENEIGLLRDRFGPDWFTKLGYSEPEYERPRPLICDHLGLATESVGGTPQCSPR
jgi:hypothetical protein